MITSYTTFREGDDPITEDARGYTKKHWEAWMQRILLDLRGDEMMRSLQSMLDLCRDSVDSEFVHNKLLRGAISKKRYDVFDKALDLINSMDFQVVRNLVRAICASHKMHDSRDYLYRILQYVIHKFVMIPLNMKNIFNILLVHQSDLLVPFARFVEANDITMSSSHSSSNTEIAALDHDVIQKIYGKVLKAEDLVGRWRMKSRAGDHDAVRELTLLMADGLVSAGEPTETFFDLLDWTDVRREETDLCKLVVPCEVTSDIERTVSNAIDLYKDERSVLHRKRKPLIEALRLLCDKGTKKAVDTLYEF